MFGQQHQPIILTGDRVPHLYYVTRGVRSGGYHSTGYLGLSSAKKKGSQKKGRTLFWVHQDTSINYRQEIDDFGLP